MSESQLAPNQPAEVDQEQAIRELAYSNWEQAGRPDGDGVAFWLAAEEQYLAHHEAEARHDGSHAGAMIVRPKALPNPKRSKTQAAPAVARATRA